MVNMYKKTKKSADAAFERLTKYVFRGIISRYVAIRGDSMLGVKKDKVVLCEYDPAWKQIAADTIVELKNVLGTFAVDIQHVGSTAIPGMICVPVIDIAVGVRFLEDVNKFIPELAGIGVYHVPGKDNARRIFFCRGDIENGIVTHNIHFVEHMDERWQGFINFRRYISYHTDFREEYIALKREALEKYPHNLDMYNAFKADFTRSITRKISAKNYLGKTVTVNVTRPVGTKHPIRKNIMYPINYGVADGQPGADGEPMRAYVLGVKTPVSSFTGTVIGIIHRGGDCGERLVLAPAGVYINQARIEEAVHFREKFYDITVDALYQKSAGMIVYRKTPEGIKYLLLFQKRSGTWSFPKGHMEMCETELQTAKREVFEEIGQHLRPHKNFRHSVTYRLAAPCRKTVVLFLAESNDPKIVFESVMSEYRWLKYDDACRLFWNSNYRRILAEAESFIYNLGRKSKN